MDRVVKIMESNFAYTAEPKFGYPKPTAKSETVEVYVHIVGYSEVERLRMTLPASTLVKEVKKHAIEELRKDGDPSRTIDQQFTYDESDFRLMPSTMEQPIIELSCNGKLNILFRFDSIRNQAKYIIKSKL